MQVSAIGQPPSLFPVNTAEKREAGEGSFAGMVDKALKYLNDIQVKADNLTSELLTGEIEDIHQVTIAMQEARLAMQLAVEVRNKAVEAYQEISRMQI